MSEISYEVYLSRKHYHYDNWGWDWYKKRSGKKKGVTTKYIRLDLDPHSDVCQPFVDYSGVYLVCEITSYKHEKKVELDISGDDDMSYNKTFNCMSDCLSFIDALKRTANYDRDGHTLDKFLSNNMIFTN